MILGIYSINDRLVGFLQPVTDSNDAAAIRNFENVVLTPGTLYDHAPEDFSLFRVASFDSETGLVTPLSQPDLLVTGQQVHLKSLKEDLTCV